MCLFRLVPSLRMINRSVIGCQIELKTAERGQERRFLIVLAAGRILLALLKGQDLRQRLPERSIA